MIQRQFGENVEMLPPRKFRFADRGQQAKIEIQFQRNIPDSGWILALESNNKVETSGSHTRFLYVWESVTSSPFFQLPQFIYVEVMIRTTLQHHPTLYTQYNSQSNASQSYHTQQ